MYWIARDCDGTLRAFSNEPIWDEEYQEDWQGDDICFIKDEENIYKDILCCEKKMFPGELSPQ